MDDVCPFLKLWGQLESHPWMNPTWPNRPVPLNDTKPEFIYPWSRPLLQASARYVPGGQCALLQWIPQVSITFN